MSRRARRRRPGAGARAAKEKAMIRSLTRLEARNRRLRMLLVLPAAAAAAAGLTGKLGTIERPDGSAQATYNGHPLYTFIMDTGPGTDKGNGVNAFGGLWHALTASGSAAPAPSGSSSRHHSAPPSHAAV